MNGAQYCERRPTVALYKGTLLFNYQGTPSVGFSESFEFESSSDTAAKSNLATWPAQRIKWLANQWKIVGFRLARVTGSAVSGKCKKKFAPIQIGACPGNPSGLLSDADTPWTGVLFKISWGNPAQRPRMFIARGVPDTWWSGGQLSIPALDGNKFLAWFNFMRSGAVQGAKGYFDPGYPTCTLVTTALSSYCSLRIASRRIGRPFMLIRGRKSKKKVP
jgi:hypothetical protein